MNWINLVIKNIGLLIVLLFGVTIIAKGQSKGTGLMEPGSKPFYTELRITKSERVPVSNYGHIIIKDLRPDNSKMGYVKIDVKSVPRHITFPKQSEEYLNEIFNSAIHPKGDMDTITIVINEIWLNETITEAAMAHKLLLGTQKLVSSCYFNADVYTKKDAGYILLGTFDSLITKKGEWLPNNCDKLLERVTIDLIKTADGFLSLPYAAENFYTRQEFDSILQAQFQYPILKADKPTRGIYFSYGDFLNDKPTPIDFKVISERLRTIDYPGRNKKDSAWGYCDGENIYMHIGPGYYKLVGSQNTFEVFGPATVVIMNTFFEKAFRVAGDYFSSPKIPFNYYSPIGARIVDPTPLFDPDKYVIEYFKYFRLNMEKGFLN